MRNHSYTKPRVIELTFPRFNDLPDYSAFVR